MTRHFPYILRLVVCGLAATVLISWSLAAWSTLTSAEVNRPPFDSRFPPLGITPPAGWELRTWVPRRGPGLRHDIVTEMEWIGSRLGMMEGRGNRYMERAAAGWPVPCLQWATDDDTKPGPILRGLPVPLPHREWPERRLPLKPLWAGLAVDVAVWTIAAMVLVTWFGFVRANRRIRRGLCPWCAYPASGTAVCPECGRAAKALRTPGPS
jgi:hypothetical protein